PQPLGRSVAALDSASVAAPQRARGALPRRGGLGEPALRRALAGRTSLEVRRRAERLLEPLASAAGSPGRLRARRAVGVLEHIDTPAARALLVRLGAGAPGAWLTREARAALERRARRFPGRP